MDKDYLILKTRRPLAHPASGMKMIMTCLPMRKENARVLEAVSLRLAGLSSVGAASHESRSA
jgi:hypothetical protein